MWLDSLNAPYPVQRTRTPCTNATARCVSAVSLSTRGTRTHSDTRDTSHAVHLEPPFLERPPPPRPSSLERHCVGPSGGGNSASAWIPRSAPATKHTQEDTEDVA